eukprot:COSAG01_NODE_6200_length_3797_cov_318.655760_3_plen_170_part_00
MTRHERHTTDMLCSSCCYVHRMLTGVLLPRCQRPNKTATQYVHGTTFCSYARLARSGGSLSGSCHWYCRAASRAPAPCALGPSRTRQALHPRWWRGSMAEPACRGWQTLHRPGRRQNCRAASLMSPAGCPPPRPRTSNSPRWRRGGRDRPLPPPLPHSLQVRDSAAAPR